MRDLPQLLRAGDALVVNTTKVIPARLIGTRLRTDGEGAKIEIALIERLGPVDWRCFMKPAKKVKDGDIIDFGGVEAEVSEREEARRGLFPTVAGRDGNQLVELALCRCRLILPENAPDAQDNDDYQTLFAREEGAVAAPTPVCTSRPRWSRH